MGRELPPADVRAADQRITWWAKQLRAAGLDGDMDQLRARAYLDILLNKDSRPSARPERAAGSATGDVDGEPGSRPEGEDGGRAERSDGEEPGGPGHGGSAPSDPDEPGIPPTAGVLPAGFAGRLHLTVPLTTPLNLAERPREIPGLGPAARAPAPAGPRTRAPARPPPPPPARDSRSPLPAITGRPADTAPGGCPPDPG